MFFDIRNEIRHQMIHSVYRTLDERDQTHGVLRNASEDQPVDLRRIAPITGISLQHHPVVLYPLHKSKRTRANGVPGKVSAVFPYGGGTHDPAEIHREIRQKRRIGTRQLNGNRMIVHSLHIADDLAHRHTVPILECSLHAVKGMVGLKLAGKREHDRIRGERSAVVEHDVPPEFKRPRFEVVRCRPGLRQPRRQLGIFRAEGYQVIVYIVADLE